MSGSRSRLETLHLRRPRLRELTKASRCCVHPRALWMAERPQTVPVEHRERTKARRRLGARPSLSLSLSESLLRQPMISDAAAPLELRPDCQSATRERAARAAVPPFRERSPDPGASVHPAFRCRRWCAQIAACTKSKCTPPR